MLSSLTVARQRLGEGRIGRTEGTNPMPAWWPGTVAVGGGHVASLDDPRVIACIRRRPPAIARRYAERKRK